MDWGPAILVLLTAVALYVRETLSIVPRCMLFVGVGLVVIVAGGVVMESTTNFLNRDDLKWIWDFEIVVEETLEMLGSLSIAYGLCVWRDQVAQDCVAHGSPSRISP